MDFHAAMETFAEAWVAANTQTAVNADQQQQSPQQQQHNQPPQTQSQSPETLTTMMGKRQMCMGLEKAGEGKSGQGPVTTSTGAKSLPIHCIVEQMSGVPSFTSTGTDTPPRTSVEIDSYAILPSTTLLTELIRTALLKLGYGSAEAMGAKGAIQLKNWKPLPFEVITDNSQATVGDILGDLTNNATLRIRICSKRTLSSTDDVKEKLLQLLLTQSQGILSISGCPIEKDMLQSISKGEFPPTLSEEARQSFDKWYIEQIKHASGLNASENRDSRKHPEVHVGQQPGTRDTRNTQHAHENQQNTPEKGLNTSHPRSHPHPLTLQNTQTLSEFNVGHNFTGFGPHRSRNRTSFDYELEIPRLQKWFQLNQHPTRDQMVYFLQELNSLSSRRGRKPLDLTNIIYWFKNARAAYRRASKSLSDAMEQDENVLNESFENDNGVTEDVLRRENQNTNDSSQSGIPFLPNKNAVYVVSNPLHKTTCEKDWKNPRQGPEEDVVTGHDGRNLPKRSQFIDNIDVKKTKIKKEILINDNNCEQSNYVDICSEDMRKVSSLSLPDVRDKSRVRERSVQGDDREVSTGQDTGSDAGYRENDDTDDEDEDDGKKDDDSCDEEMILTTKREEEVNVDENNADEQLKYDNILPKEEKEELREDSDKDSIEAKSPKYKRHHHHHPQYPVIAPRGPHPATPPIPIPHLATHPLAMSYIYVSPQYYQQAHAQLSQAAAVAQASQQCHQGVPPIAHSGAVPAQGYHEPTHHQSSLSPGQRELTISHVNDDCQSPASSPDESNDIDLEESESLMNMRRKRRTRVFIDPLTEIPCLERWFQDDTHPHAHLIDSSMEMCWSDHSVRCAVIELLKEMGQSSLAKLSPLSQSTISNISNGKYSNRICPDKCKEFGHWYLEYKQDIKAEVQPQIETRRRDSRMTFHSIHELPMMRQWYRAFKSPTDEKLQFFANELNKGHVRHERPKLSVVKLKIWWRNERQREKRLEQRSKDKEAGTSNDGTLISTTPSSQMMSPLGLAPSSSLSGNMHLANPSPSNSSLSSPPPIVVDDSDNLVSLHGLSSHSIVHPIQPLRRGIISSPQPISMITVSPLPPPPAHITFPVPSHLTHISPHHGSVPYPHQHPHNHHQH